MCPLLSFQAMHLFAFLFHYFPTSFVLRPFTRPFRAYLAYLMQHVGSGTVMTLRLRKHAVTPIAVN